MSSQRFWRSSGSLVLLSGAWMAYGSDDELLTKFGWTWNVSDIREMWGPILMIGGGVLSALTMGVESARDWNAENSSRVIWSEAFLAVVGLASIVVLNLPTDLVNSRM